MFNICKVNYHLEQRERPYSDAVSDANPAGPI